jgi:hypothetical protein
MKGLFVKVMGVVTKSRVLSLLLLTCTVLWTHVVDAKNNFLCDAKQASTRELPRLDQACPIGHGLWGKQQPKRQDSMFWIQCGVFKQPLPLEQAKVLYRQISTDVWMKPESQAYRCLIGPYDDIQKARQELKNIHGIRPYRQAFIREIVKHQGTSSLTSKPALMHKSSSVTKLSIAKKSIAKKSVANTSVSKMKSTVKQTVAKAAVKKDTVKKATVKKVKPLPTAAASKSESRQGKLDARPVLQQKVANVSAASSVTKTIKNIDIRKQTVLGGVTYRVLFVGKDQAQFYMEYNKPWSRLSYEDTRTICQKIDMHLATEKQWQVLRRSGIMTQKQWPVYLPYWGKDRKGLFANGKVTQLKGTSLLNILCVK